MTKQLGIFWGILWIFAVLCGCANPHIGEAQKQLNADDPAAAVTVIEQALKDMPEDEKLLAALKVAKKALKNAVLSSKAIERRRIDAEFELILPHLETDGVDDDLRRAYVLKRKLAKRTGDIRGAVEALHKASQHTGSAFIKTQYAVESAHLLEEHPKTEGAPALFARLVAAHPKDQNLCASHAQWLGNSRQFDTAATEYERCKGIDPQNLEKAFEYSAKAAALKQYQKVEGAKNNAKE